MLVRAVAPLLAFALPVAAAPAWGTEPRAGVVSEGPSCRAPGVVDQLGSLQAAVVRAVHLETQRGSASPAGETVVLNGRGYNYGPPLVTLAPTAPPALPGR